jgi:hypothetical protein
MRYLQIVKAANATSNNTEANNTIPFIPVVAVPQTAMKWNSSLTLAERQEYEVK